MTAEGVRRLRPTEGLTGNVCGWRFGELRVPELDRAKAAEGSAVGFRRGLCCPDSSQSRNLKVLVTDAYYKHALAIVRSLGQQGHRVTVLANAPNDIAARSRYCSAVEYLDAGLGKGVGGRVVDILRRNSHDVLLPVGYATTLALALETQALSHLTRMVTADPEQICLAADKERVRELAESLGIPVPATLYPASIDDLERGANRLGYPLILKVRTESAGITVRIVKSQEALMPAFRSLCRGSPLTAECLPMVQEFIPGHGCGFFALYEYGACRRIFMHRRIRENPPTGGISCCAESFYDAKLKELSTTLLDALHWHGVAMVEFRLDSRDGQYKLLEINPKFWGSLDLALAAGADFPGDICRLATGVPVPYSEEYQRGLRYHWLLSGELQHVVSNPRSLLAVLGDCLNPCVKSNLWLNDPGPTLSEMQSLVESARRRFRKAGA